ncbi:hypothetical protein UCRPC4_g05805 [Phaeomoniella chlamydospora]|uniref:Aminoglycoside phosphotransferase domain-containing protein n=1 Tax=Phaeomoniella chlamydospora TaxID=158046 RepID=A0A0G2E1D9_PHACM|nr:hypothetical protein UCRPC4_g05805 [Phaeomoniella chlamydospora]
MKSHSSELAADGSADGDMIHPEEKPPGIDDIEGSDSQSQTSTDKYTYGPDDPDPYESFESFKFKVLKLAQEIWPSHEINIEKMAGGGYNRVIRLQVNDRIEVEDSEPIRPRITPGVYILRVPRSLFDSDVERERAILQFVKNRTTLPIPIEVAGDSGSNNALGRPFVLQHMLSGTRLDKVWGQLNHNQRLSLTKEMARFYVEMQDTTNSSAGRLALNLSLRPDGSIQTFDFSSPVDKAKDPLTPTEPFQFMCEKILTWHNCFRISGFENGFPYFSQMLKMVKRMQAIRGTFNPQEYYLRHNDLYPRNILVSIRDEDTAVITGILDWDDTYFAPTAVAFAPPTWLWLKDYWIEEEEDDDEYADPYWAAASKTPDDRQSQEIKHTFDQIVGSNFLKHAYSPDSKMVQFIWDILNESPLLRPWIMQYFYKKYKEWKSTISEENKALLDDGDYLSDLYDDPEMPDWLHEVLNQSSEHSSAGNKSSRHEQEDLSDNASDIHLSSNHVHSVGDNEPKDSTKIDQSISETLPKEIVDVQLPSLVHNALAEAATCFLEDEDE